jgi:hypothetical protein
LTDFWLIWRVGSEEFTSGDELEDGSRNVIAVKTCAKERNSVTEGDV